MSATAAPVAFAARKLCTEDFAFGALLGEGSYARVRRFLRDCFSVLLSC
jgi:hypothetical protein